MQTDLDFYKLQTQRLRLAPIAQGDVKIIFETLVKHPEITEFLTFDPPKNISETEAFFHHCQETWGTENVTWVIWKDDVFCGLIGLNSIKRKQCTWTLDTADIGYWLTPEMQGQGIMTEAAQAVVKFGFQKMKLHTITGKHVSENDASGHVLQKIGLKFVGETQDHFFRFGHWGSERVYQMSASDLPRS